MRSKSGPKLLGHLCGIGLLVIAALLYLQFGLQAIGAAPLQAILVLLGAIALGTATVLFARGRPLAPVVFMGTVPLLAFSIWATFAYADESPVFAIVFAIAPIISGISWLRRVQAVHQRA